MKKHILLFCLAIFSQIAIAQCARSASGFGNNTRVPSYNVAGDVTVTLNTNNTVTLDLGSNFNTASGPDIRAYLVKSNGVSNAVLASTKIENLENIQFGLVGCEFMRCSPEIPANGAKTFTVPVPNGINIFDYDTVFFYCLEFDQFWDFGAYTPFVAGSCSLSVEENTLESANLYPNPAENTFRINTSTNELAQIKIYNALGKLYYSGSHRLNSDIDITNLKRGLYFLSITTKKGEASKKLVIN